MRTSIGAALSLVFIWITSAAASPATQRTFEFVYTTQIVLPAAAEGPVHVFLPLPRESDSQQVHETEVSAPIPGRIETEAVYRNRYWHGTTQAAAGQELKIEVRSVVSRSATQSTSPLSPAGAADSAAADPALARYLGPNARVAVNHEILTPILTEIRHATPGEDTALRARGIYDWVVDNVEYKKVGTGWGNGDTFWACNERYGNCTDFHALFISLARSEGIPARFEMGFPLPSDRSEGSIGGYHCWVQFHLEGRGWFPIDASEASKHPELRERLYGGLPADRIHFTTGRDLKLGADHHDTPLNYFVYPYVELSGKAWRGQIENDFSYRDLSGDELEQAIGG